MSTWYISSAQWTAVTAWAALTAKSAGNLVRQNAAPSVGSERVFVCIIAGTTLAAEPTWTTTKGAKTAEAAGPTWQECTGQSAVNGDVINTPASSTVRSVNPGLGKIIKNNTATHYFICSTAGTCGAGEPTYDTTAGNTTTDSGATWTCLGTVGTFGAFDAPHARLSNSFASTWGVAGDTFYVGDDHAATQSSSLTLTSPGTVSAPDTIICIDKTVAPPTTVTHLKTTATETTTGNSFYAFSAIGFFQGITFSAGTGATAQSVLLNTGSATSGNLIFKNCGFKKLGTTASTTGAIRFGSSTNTYSNKIILDNCTMEFGATGDVLGSYNSHVRWINTPTAITGATLPNKLIYFNTTPGSYLQLEGVDLSALSSKSLIADTCQMGTVKLINCKLPSTFTLTPTTPVAGFELEVINCASDTTNYNLNRYQRSGSQVTVTNPIRTGGASDEVTSYSWNVTSTSSVSFNTPYQTFPLAVWNATTGSNRTITIYGVYNGSDDAKNGDIWLEVEYLGSSATPQASFQTTAKAAAFIPSVSGLRDGSAWNSAASARANSTAYSVGDIVKPSGTSTVMFCTTAGTTAASAPTTATTWTTRTSSADNDWRSICWSPELALFCAVGVSGTGTRVMTSPDGITWTTRTSAANNSWVDVCWSPELTLFCAVAASGTGNRVMTSPDGITWTTRTSAADNGWTGVCWAPALSLFCAVGNSGTGNRVMTSPDGITWTTRTSAADNVWNAVCWSQELNLFCAIANNGTGNRVMTSPDGITWTTRTSAADTLWIDICWAPEINLFCAVNTSGVSSGVMTSPDGITWTSRTSAATNAWRSVIWSGGYFVAVSNTGTGNRVMTSPDGITWTSRTSASNNDWQHIAYSASLGLFCAVSNTGTATRIMTSPDGMDYPGSGALVTDGTAVFRAGYRFKIQTTLSSPQPGLKGYVYVRANVAKASSTYYIDPKIVLS